MHSEKTIKSDNNAPKVKISIYLSTNLVTVRDLTIADIKVETYPASKISTMESDLVDSVSHIRLRPLLIDPKAEMKAAKQVGNTDTLVDYDRIWQLTE